MENEEMNSGHLMFFMLMLKSKFNFNLQLLVVTLRTVLCTHHMKFNETSDNFILKYLIELIANVGNVIPWFK